MINFWVFQTIVYNTVNFQDRAIIFNFFKSYLTPTIYFLKKLYCNTKCLKILKDLISTIFAIFFPNCPRHHQDLLEYRIVHLIWGATQNFCHILHWNWHQKHMVTPVKNFLTWVEAKSYVRVDRSWAKKIKSFAESNRKI